MGHPTFPVDTKLLLTTAVGQKRHFDVPGQRMQRDSYVLLAIVSHFLRHGETTIITKFALLRGVGHGGGEENRPQSCSSWETP